jgi:predicted aspartyl protease
MPVLKSWLMLAVLLATMPAWAVPDRTAEIERLQPTAENGDAAAQYKVGVLYAESQKLSDAARWYKLAADQGHHEAQTRLASLKCNGLGVSKDLEDCIRLYRLAAEGGVTQAQVSLAARYLTGDGTATNHGEAVRLARIAADKADPTGQLLLGICYETGAGVSKDRNEAIRLYRLSAARGNASAQKGLERLGVEAVAPAAPPSTTVAVTTLTINLRRQSGVLMVPAVLNDSVSANFIVDSGASDVAIPETLLDALRKAGKFTDADFTGTQMAKIADGRVVKARTFVLRSFSVSNRVLDNVRASALPGNATPLLGQSFLQRFASWSIDNERQVLLLREKETMAR